MRKSLILRISVFVLLATLVFVTATALAKDGLLGTENNSPSEQVEKRLFTEREIRRVIRKFAPEYRSSRSPDVISCSVKDGTGTPVTTVSAATYGDTAYWLYYGSGGAAASNVVFMTRPLFSGSPLTRQIQRFHFDTPSGTNIETPFGIPYWASDLTSGPWVLVVKNNLGDRAICRFNVIP